MSLLTRILGMPKTQPPRDPACWRYSNNRLEIDLNRAVELKDEGKGLRLEGRGLPVRVLVLKGEDGQYLAIRNRCTHFGRRLDPLPGQSVLECCSVNKSRFDHQGAKISGPAKGPVQTFRVSRTGGLLIVELEE